MKRGYFSILAIISVGVLAVFAVANAGSYLETFSGTPSAPSPFAPESFEVRVHERAMHSNPGGFPAMVAQHGPGCEGPHMGHGVSTAEQAVFICNDHVMTAINGNEYGVIYLTPPAMVDVSTQGVVRFDVSQGDQSTRDWIDLWITPYADHLAAPLQDDLPDLNGSPRNGIHLQQDFAQNKWQLKVIRDGVQTVYGFGPTASGFTPDFARRDTMEVTVTPTRVTMRMPQYNVTLVDQAIPTLTWTRGVVQLGHHSYDPMKDGAGLPNTWHWDNLEIDPFVPFTIQKAGGPRYITSSGTVTFPPAPAGATLKFSALGRPIVNGVARDPIPSTKWPASPSYEHAFSYSVPIAEGATSATVSMTSIGWYNIGRYLAQDFYVWSVGAGGGTPTSTPTVEPTATPSPQPTPESTPVVTPTPTPTPAPVTGVCRVQFNPAGPAGWYEIDRATTTQAVCETIAGMLP